MIKKVYFQTEETTIKRTQGYVEVETDYIQLYRNFVKVSSKISSVTTFKLLHWLLAERLDESNGVNSGKMFTDFNAYLNDGCGEDCKISETTFYRCLEELVHVGAITKVEKARYLANINLFWGSSTEERTKSLKLFAKDDNPKIKMLNPSAKPIKINPS